MTAERLLFLAQSNHTPLMCEHLYEVDQNCHSSQYSWARHWWKIWKKGIISDFLCAGKVNDCALKNCREGAFVCVCVSVLAFWSVKQRFLIFAGILFENKWWRQQKVLQLFGLMSLPYTDVFCWPHSLNYLDYNNCCVHTLIIKSVFP